MKANNLRQRIIVDVLTKHINLIDERVKTYIRIIVFEQINNTFEPVKLAITDQIITYFIWNNNINRFYQLAWKRLK